MEILELLDLEEETEALLQDDIIQLMKQLLEEVPDEYNDGEERR